MWNSLMKKGEIMNDTVKCPYCRKEMEKGFVFGASRGSGYPWLPDDRFPFYFTRRNIIKRGGVILVESFGEWPYPTLPMHICRECRKGIVEWNNNGLPRSRQIKESNEKECPLCKKKIREEAVFCEFCGGSVKEHEENEKARKQQEFEEMKKRRLREFEESGFNALLNDEDIMKQAKEIRRVYGKTTYVSFLKGKAKELGFGDIELTEDDVE